MRGDRVIRSAQRTAEGSPVVMLLGLAVSYWSRLPATAFITVLPPWFWASAGVLLVIGARSRGRASRTVLLLALWAAFLLGFCEEPWAIVTGRRAWPDPGWQAARGAGKGLRIITFNCGDGGRAAAEEALAYSPDVLILEESPTEKDLRDVLASHPDFDLLYGFDVSIIARGKLTAAVPARARWMFNAAYLTLGGTRVGLVGIRLRVPHFSFGIWSPREWSLAAASQRDHEAEIRYVLEQIASMDPATPLVIAGDFNAPAGDAVFRLMPSGFRDAFLDAGIGLGNTMMNDLPVSRIDQVWLDPRITPVATVARKTASSDHRLVIADVSIR